MKVEKKPSDEYMVVATIKSHEVAEVEKELDYLLRWYAPELFPKMRMLHSFLRGLTYGSDQTPQ